MRTIGWCMLFLSMVAGAAAAENAAATQTTLTVATDNAGPRTRVTLTAHVSGVSNRLALGSSEFSLRQ